MLHCAFSPKDVVASQPLLLYARIKDSRTYQGENSATMDLEPDVIENLKRFSSETTVQRLHDMFRTAANIIDCMHNDVDAVGSAMLAAVALYKSARGDNATEEDLIKGIVVTYRMLESLPVDDSAIRSSLMREAHKSAGWKDG